MSETQQVPKYSFYLNVVVIDTPAPALSLDSDATPVKKEPELIHDDDDDNDDDKEAEKKIKDSLAIMSPSLKLSGKAMWASLKQSSDSFGQKASAFNDNLSKKTQSFIASKTMMARASAAVKDIIPELLEDMNGIDIAITKRFQQANVFVLEVDMKGCCMIELIKKTRGEEVAHLYEQVKMGMELLGTEKAIKSFEHEFLPKARHGLMEKLSSLLLDKIKVRESDLAVECITLEDQEEARWLYTFLEFSQQMKNQKAI
mmetsp:Transcript_38374/g.57477  ORF Transcript_38374/g.57477 Transcript_38374/m.57477 type:complete len:258 (-) Transcript_38374:435-1208(-)